MFMLRYIVLGFIAIGCLSPSFAQENLPPLVKERMEGFSSMQTKMKALWNSLKEDQLDTVPEHAESIALWFEELEKYFPPGSNPHPSKALDRIWQEPDDFFDIAEQAKDAALILEIVSAAGDIDAANDAFKTLASTCKACHSKFRK